MVQPFERPPQGLVACILVSIEIPHFGQSVFPLIESNEEVEPIHNRFNLFVQLLTASIHPRGRICSDQQFPEASFVANDKRILR
jgi:hypothetical protein